MVSYFGAQISQYQSGDHGFETRQGQFFPCLFLNHIHWKLDSQPPFEGYRQKFHRRNGSDPAISCRSKVLSEYPQVYRL